jgi:hypothetical protein
MGKLRCDCSKTHIDSFACCTIQPLKRIRIKAFQQMGFYAYLWIPYSKSTQATFAKGIKKVDLPR